MLTSNCEKTPPNHLRDDLQVLKFGDFDPRKCNPKSGAAYSVGPVFSAAEYKPYV